MSKSNKLRSQRPRKASAVSDVMLAQYERARRVPSTREEVRTVLSFLQDHATLTAVGEPTAAAGAALEAVDIALRLAATPAPTDEDLSLKGDFLRLQFGPFAKACGHPQVATIAAAALAAERALGPDHRRTQDVRRTSSGQGRSANRVVDPIGPDATQARLRAYAEGAETIGEIQGLLMAMDLVLVDRRALSREGRAKMSLGAERFFDALLRRLCVSTATSTDWAKVKVAILSAAKDDMLGANATFRGEAAACALTVAMIDAAVSIEGEDRPRCSSLH